MSRKFQSLRRPDGGADEGAPMTSAIAEHVEDAATLETLRQGGVDFAQGFYIGEPALLRA